jgi:pimeloyl-ACP methyl ester carboxylesterase
MKWLAVSFVVALLQSAQLPAPPGRLVEVNGRTLHLHCTGSGTPTVILEAGASSFAIDWSLVQPAVARSQRVCSYDRAGMGWSDRSDDVDSGRSSVSDLHALLAAAQEAPPSVMVGASRGALYVRLYQLEYPSEVVGLVLVDPATEDRLFIMYKGAIVPIAGLSAQEHATTLPTTASVPIRSRRPQTGTPFDRLPADLYDIRITLDQRLIDSLGSSMPGERARAFAESDHAMLARLLQSRSAADTPFRRVPVVVLTRGLDMTDGLADNHAALAGLSLNSRHSIVRDSGHEVPLFAPDAVIDSIRDVTAAAVKGTPVAPGA